MSRTVRGATLPCLLVLGLGLAAAPAANAGGTLDRILETKSIRLGVRTDAPPFASIVDGRPAGFTAELCGLMAGAILATSDIGELDGTFVGVEAEGRFQALASGEIDVLCGATTATLTRRETMSFTIPTFATGIGALVRADAPALLKEVLITGGPAAFSGAAVGEALKDATLAARAGTTAESWLRGGPIDRIGGATIETVDDHAAGLAGVRDGTFEVYFADRAILAGLVNAEGAGDVAISRSTFSFEPYALAIPRGDEELRLVLDRALSHLYRSGAIFKIYEKYFGPPGAEELIFYGTVALPE